VASRIGEPRDDLLLLNGSGTRRPIFWCLNNWAEAVLLAHRLGPDQPLFAMHSFNKVLSGTRRKARLLEALAASYVEQSLRHSQAYPEIVGGNCQAAPVAEAMAHQIGKASGRVPLLVMLEYMPQRPYTGPALMMFGGSSFRYNPFLSSRDPLPIWNSQLENYSWAILNGNHGRYFVEPAISDLCTALERVLASVEENGKVPGGELILPAPDQNHW
jgi:thioesterase domain-containing protein